MAKASHENFPVASRLLPAGERDHLLAVYGFARFVDDIGDEWPGNRLAALSWLEAELDRALAGEPAHPLVTRAAATVSSLGLDQDLLRRLIEANRCDQIVDRYATFEDLLGYCRLSAVPIGRLVLGIFGVATPPREWWSDRVCAGLQLAEHWQDAGEDASAGRVYLPLKDLDRFGVTVDELHDQTSSPSLRGLMGFEVARARRLLDEGTPLVGDLHGRPRWAVAGFVAGGHAALDAIAHADFDVLAAAARPRPRRVLRRMVGILTKPRCFDD